ncbi:basic form of pathogenesis-related protein 1-like [Carya illinoinensis]|nr:basic form of pathogenesis-related protein 1-like [Carya illinoinensis]
MGFGKLFQAICFIGFTLVQASLAQNSYRDFLDGQNAARAEVGVAPLTWNHTLQVYAKNYANKRRDCNLEHSNGPYGENIAQGWGTFSAVEAVKMWVDEKQFYDVKSNSCKGGECLHYTQVVWRNTKSIGCARVNCYKDGGIFMTCNYDPIGNYDGERPF